MNDSCHATKDFPKYHTDMQNDLAEIYRIMCEGIFLLQEKKFHIISQKIATTTTKCYAQI